MLAPRPTRRSETRSLPFALTPPGTSTIWPSSAERKGTLINSLTGDLVDILIPDMWGMCSEDLVPLAARFLEALLVCILWTAAVDMTHITLTCGLKYTIVAFVQWGAACSEQSVHSCQLLPQSQRGHYQTEHAV